MVVHIYDYGCHLLVKCDGNVNYRIFLADEDILSNDRLEVLVVDSNINLLLSQSVFASQIAALLNLKLGDATIRGPLNNRLEDVHTTGREPLITPLPEVKVGAKGLVAVGEVGLVESSYEVLELCVLPLVTREVDSEAPCYHFSAKHVVQLLQERSPLSVRDTIEKVLCLVSSVDSASDWVSRANLVVVDAPEFVLEESDPMSFEI